MQVNSSEKKEKSVEAFYFDGSRLISDAENADFYGTEPSIQTGSAAFLGEQGCPVGMASGQETETSTIVDIVLTNN